MLLFVAIAVTWTARAEDITETDQMHSATADPYLWLEDIHGSNSLDWVKGRTPNLRRYEPDADYQQDHDTILKTMDAT